MGLFDSVAGTFFNTATAAYKTVVAPVQTAVQTITRPVVQGSYSPPGATEQVAVQPRPPIVTSVANQNTFQAQQAMVGPQATYTPQTTPSGQQVYVSSRPSPNTPKPIEVTRPVQVQAPSIAESIGMLAPGAGIVGAAQLISGDRRVVQNVISDLPGTGTFVTGAPTLAGYRETNIRQQEAIAQARIEQQNREVEQIKINKAAQTLRNEQAILGYNQREQALRREVSEFNALGPATSIEEYNTRLNTSNLLNTKIQELQTEGSKINADNLAGKQNLYKQQIGLLNENDAINRDLVNLNVASANLGTTGIGGLSAGWEARVDKPLAEATMGAVGSPFGLSSAEVRQGLALNRMVGEARVNAGDYSPSALSHAFGSGMLEDTLTKPGTALAWTVIGIATGGVTRALAPGMEAAVAASRVPGAALGTRALGTGIRAAPYVMGGLFAGQVGFETGFESTPTGLKMRTPGGMVSRLGGLTATEIVPMIGGGIIGYNAPEIGQAAYRGVRAGELRFRRFGEGLGEEGLLGPGGKRTIKTIDLSKIQSEEPIRLIEEIELPTTQEKNIFKSKEIQSVMEGWRELPGVEDQLGFGGISVRPTKSRIPVGTSTGLVYPEEMSLPTLDLRPQIDLSLIEGNAPIRISGMLPPEEIEMYSASIGKIWKEINAAETYMNLPEFKPISFKSDVKIRDVLPGSFFETKIIEPSAKPIKIEQVFSLREAKQVSDLQYLGMQGTLLKPGQKVMVDAKLTNLSMGGVKPLSIEDISIALGTSTFLKPLTQPVVSTKQQQKKDQLLMAGFLSGSGLADFQAQAQRPVSIQGSRVMPISLNLQDVGLQQITLQRPILDTQLRTQIIQTPDIGLVPITSIIQVPDITTKLIQQQINITDLEIPPYTPPSYKFEIPLIPPIIIPGFPMGGGGGGGGGFGGDRGGYLFEETLKGGGDSDPFGIGGMNFDVGSLSGAPTSSGRRRRRKR